MRSEASSDGDDTATCSGCNVLKALRRGVAPYLLWTPRRRLGEARRRHTPTLKQHISSIISSIKGKRNEKRRKKREKAREECKAQPTKSLLAHKLLISPPVIPPSPPYRRAPPLARSSQTEHQRRSSSPAPPVLLLAAATPRWSTSAAAPGRGAGR